MHRKSTTYKIKDFYVVGTLKLRRNFLRSTVTKTPAISGVFVTVTNYKVLSLKDLLLRNNFLI
jgi:hypothetical protein